MMHNHPVVNSTQVQNLNSIFSHLKDLQNNSPMNTMNTFVCNLLSCLIRPGARPLNLMGVITLRFTQKYSRVRISDTKMICSNCNSSHNYQAYNFLKLQLILQLLLLCLSCTNKWKNRKKVLQFLNRQHMNLLLQ